MSGELITLPEVAGVASPVQPTTPMSLIQSALSSGATMETIERLVALQEHMLAREAEVAFNAAMARAQARMGRVAADSNNPQTKSKYASYAALDKELRPIYTEEGFALSYDTRKGEGESMDVLCHVSHSAGHTRTYSVNMPTDGKGAKGGDVMTKTHATGSAATYGQRYLLKLIFNVAIGENDNDGNGDMPEDVFQGHLKNIREAKTMDELQQFYNAAYRAAHRDQVTQGALIKAKDARKAELRGVR